MKATNFKAKNANSKKEFVCTANSDVSSDDHGTLVCQERPEVQGRRHHHHSNSSSSSSDSSRSRSDHGDRVYYDPRFPIPGPFVPGPVIPPAPVAPVVASSFRVDEHQFDCSETNPNFPSFETHSPVQPPFVSNELWTALLNNIVNEQRRLTRNFIAGRNALGLPQYERLDANGQTGILVDLVATKTVPLGSYDAVARALTAKTSIGWDLHIANTLYPEFINPGTVSASGSFSTTGNIGVDQGTLELDDPSIVLEYGQVLRDPTGVIPWGTTVYDVAQAAIGIYGLSISTAGPVRNNVALQFQASKWGPKTVSIFVQAGTISTTNQPLIEDITYGNRQFEPTIDYSNADDTGLTHTGEQWQSSRDIPTRIARDLILPSRPGTQAVLQLAVFAEREVEVYFRPPTCPPLVTAPSRRLIRNARNDRSSKFVRQINEPSLLSAFIVQTTTATTSLNAMPIVSIGLLEVLPTLECRPLAIKLTQNPPPRPAIGMCVTVTITGVANSQYNIVVRIGPGTYSLDPNGRDPNLLILCLQERDAPELFRGNIRDSTGGFITISEASNCP